MWLALILQNPASSAVWRRYGREACVRLLLAGGADVSAQNAKGQTAADVVKGESRNPLNNSPILAVLEGTAALATIQ